MLPQHMPRSYQPLDTPESRGLVPAGIQMEDELDVRLYLRRNPVVIPILAATIELLRSRNEPGAILNLSVTWYSDGDEMLSLTVHSSLDHDEASRRLDQFDDEWWLQQPSTALSNIVIHVYGKS